jgi:RNA polymerase sigma-70 factor (ECF subfamily)
MEREHDLIEKILRGDKNLFEQLVLKYQNLVFTVCLNIARDEHDAENMAQETFLAAYCALSDFHGSNFKSWLCKIAVNKSIDCKRKQSKVDIVDYIAEESDLMDGGDSVEDMLIISERREKLENILSDISAKYRVVIQAFYYDRLSVKEISQRLELPEKTIETQLYRARQIIKERWGTDGA